MLLSSVILLPQMAAVDGTRPWQVVLGGGDIRAQAAVLSDGYTVLVVSANQLSGLSASRPERVTVRTVKLPNGGYEATLTFALPLKNARVARSGPQTLLIAVPEGETDSLRDRILVALPRSVPSAFTAPRFRHAETALAELRLAEARTQYTTLATEYALKPWAEVRLADIDVLRADVGAACSRYRAAATGFNDRTAGTVARLRLRAFGCSGHADIDELAAMIESVKHVEGPVGDYLRHELIWTLAREHDGPDLARTLELLCGPASRRALGTPAAVCDTLVARTLRLTATPYEIALAFLRQQEAIAHHPEAAALRLLAAHAMLALSLPEQAVPLLESALNKGSGGPLWRERQGETQVATVLANAYVANGHAYLGRQLEQRFHLAQPPPPPVPGFESLALGRTLVDVHARIEALRDFLAPRATPSAAQQQEEHHEDGTL